MFVLNKVHPSAKKRGNSCFSSRCISGLGVYFQGVLGYHKRKSVEWNPPNMRPLKNAISKLMDPIYQRQGFIRSTIILEWKLIVGAHFSQFCQPEKISFPFEKRTGGRLVLKTTSSFAPALQFDSPLILDRINKYFGYQAVEKLILTHNLPVSTDHKPKSRQPLDEKSIKHLHEIVGGITNVDLQNALFNLGVGIMGDSSRVEEKEKEPVQNDVPEPTRPPDVYRWDGSKI